MIISTTFVILISKTNSKAVLEDRLLESNSSVLVIHDWERHYYKSMVTRSPVTRCRLLRHFAKQQ